MPCPYRLLLGETATGSVMFGQGGTSESAGLSRIGGRYRVQGTFLPGLTFLLSGKS
jgi:hypothetical protein